MSGLFFTGGLFFESGIIPDPLEVETIKAIGSNGLFLLDDENNLGIHIKDGGDVEFGGEIKVDTINETAANAGINIEDVIIKDGSVTLDFFPAQLYIGKATSAPAGWYHLNSSAGTNVVDSSGFGIDLTTVNMVDGDWVPGLINNCLQFAATKYAIAALGTDLSFDNTDAFSFEFWVNNSDTTAQIILSKMSQSAPNRGFQIVQNATTGKINFSFRNDVASNQISVDGNISIAGGGWHYGVVTYDGSSTAAGVKIYVDTVLNTHTILSDTLSATTITATKFQLSGRDTTNLNYKGKIDEWAIHNGVIDQTYINARFNAGAGTESIPGFTNRGTLNVNAATGKMTQTYGGDCEIVTTEGASEILLTPPSDGFVRVTDGDMSIANNLSVGGKLTVTGIIDPTALILDPQASAPSTDDGAIYYDSGDTEFKFRENGAWKSFTSYDTFLELTDTPSAYNAGRILFEGAAAVEDDINLFWDNTLKRLGIGQITPLVELHIGPGFTGNGNINLARTTLADEACIRLRTLNSYKWLFGMDDTTGDDFVIYDYEKGTGEFVFLIETGTGHVGLGTTSPSAKIDILNDVALGTGPGILLKSITGIVGSSNIFRMDTTDNNDQNLIEFYKGGIKQWQIVGRNELDTPNGRLAIFNDSAAEVFTILQNENIGIGTDSPLTKLSIFETGTLKANTDIISITNEANSTDMAGTETSILFKQYYYDATTPASVPAGRIVIGADGNWTSALNTHYAYMLFETTVDGVMTEHARFNSVGNFAIGLSAFSAYKLHVAGNLKIDHSGATETAIFKNADDNLDIDFDCGSGKSVLFNFLKNGSPKNSFTVDSANSMIFSSDLAPNILVIENGGFIGMGVADPSERLEVSGNTKLNGNLIVTGGITRNITTVTVASYDLLVTDDILDVTYTATGAVTIDLKTAQVVRGRTIVVKDAGFNATTNNITITTEGIEKIDNVDTAIINVDDAAITVYCDGTNWKII